ncbi:unnamed protein product [Moneuplotes crassus]|uniref:Uncharacterized protein n=1 Tax=Euplotes crassus TaxID=5936 RepID=A0AAD1XPX8_EUPCR|nr:unnamed protein product [Moneuplotes crassus]
MDFELKRGSLKEDLQNLGKYFTQIRCKYRSGFVSQELLEMFKDLAMTFQEHFGQGDPVKSNALNSLSFYDKVNSLREDPSSFWNYFNEILIQDYNMSERTFPGKILSQKFSLDNTKCIKTEESGSQRKFIDRSILSDSSLEDSKQSASCSRRREYCHMLLDMNGYVIKCSKNASRIFNLKGSTLKGKDKDKTKSSGSVPLTSLNFSDFIDKVSLGYFDQRKWINAAGQPYKKTDTLKFLLNTDSSPDSRPRGIICKITLGVLNRGVLTRDHKSPKFGYKIKARVCDERSSDELHKRIVSPRLPYFL